jgi:hypothetical protein
VHEWEHRLNELDLAQHGLVSVSQLEAWTPAAIRHRARARRRLAARGVLANPAVRQTFQQRAFAAVLAAGETAFASHETAARLWGMPLPAPALIEVTTALRRRPRVRGVRLHRSGLLEVLDVMLVDGIPLSTPELTIYSLSTRFGIRNLGRMTDDAVRRRILTLGRLEAITARLAPAPGRSRKRMEAVLAQRVPGVETRESELEDFVFSSLLRFGLPLPVPQHRVSFNGQERRIDLCYPEDRLALEAKGFRWYRTRSVWDRDVLRGNELQLAGFRVLSFTSAFTDADIAHQVADALQLPIPRSLPPRTFAQWCRRD